MDLPPSSVPFNASVARPRFATYRPKILRDSTVTLRGSVALWGRSFEDFFRQCCVDTFYAIYILRHVKVNHHAGEYISIIPR